MTVRRVAFISALAAVMAACQPTPPRPTTPPKPAASPKAAKSAPSPSPAASQEGAPLTLGAFTYNNFGIREMQDKTSQDVDAGDYYFKGTFLRGSPNQRLTLRIRNVADRAHNFSLPDQQIDVDMPVSRERVGIQVTMPASGAVRFFCKLHTAQGMNGQLLAGNIEPQPLSN